jgi:hypothetical protein
MGGYMKACIKTLSIIITAFFLLETSLAYFALAANHAGHPDANTRAGKQDIIEAEQALRDIIRNAPVPENNEFISSGKTARQIVTEPGQGGAASTLLKANAMKSISGLPVSFVENRGQTDKKVKYYARHGGATIYFKVDEIVFDFIREKNNTAAQAELKRSHVDKKAFDIGDAKRELERQVVRMKLKGSDNAAAITGVNRLQGSHNYFKGNDKSKWRTNVPAYGEVYYTNVYAGIDMKFYANNGVMEYDFIVHPGADPGQIDVAFEGINGMRVAGNGDLLMRTAFGELRQKAPHIYQLAGGKKQEIAGGFRIKHAGSAAQQNRNEFSYGFRLGSYNKEYALVIDPSMVYSTFMGGTGNDMGNSIAVDISGNVYVTGNTVSTDFPATLGAYEQNYNGGNYDVFVVKINSWGALVYATYLGGSGTATYDYGYGIAADSSGNAYVTGLTTSSDFPIVSALKSGLTGAPDAFVAKLNPAGSALLFSTYLGGSSSDEGYGIALDSSGNIYVTGYTNSVDFPTQNAYQNSKAGSFDVFVTKIDPSGSSIVYSTFFGGSGGDYGRSIAVDSSGYIYVGGYTSSSTSFPVANAVQSTYGGGSDDGFVLKLNPAGSSVIYSTYLGGSSGDQVLGIAADSSGNAYATGYTWSANFPTSNALDSSGSSQDAFITKINSSGSALVYSTYLGGSGQDIGSAIAVDSFGNAYVTGWTNSSDFPVANALDSTRSVAYDAFAAKINPAGNALVYSTYLGGGSNHDYGNGVAVDYLGNAYITGETNSADFPTANAIYNTLAGGSDAFVAELGPIGLCAGKPLKILETAVEYDTIADAYTAATDMYHTIMIHSEDFTGPISFASNKSVSLLGGYACDFDLNIGIIGVSHITDSVTVGGSATVIFDRIVIK